MAFLRTRLKARPLLLLLLSPMCLCSVDEFMSCDRLLESRRSARVLDHIPCDMTKQSFCQHKGSAYPEAAIWQFKEENRALMRRMYGDMESNTVYREMRSANIHRHSNAHHGGGGATLHNLPTEEHSLFSSLEYNIRMGSGLATVQSAREPVVQADANHASGPASGGGKKKKKVIKKKRKPSKGQVSTDQTATSTPPSSQNIGGNLDDDFETEPPVVTRQTTASLATSENTASTAKVDNQTETTTLDTTTVDFALNATAEATLPESTVVLAETTTVASGGQDIDETAAPAAATAAVATAAADLVPSASDDEDETGGATVTVSPSKLVFDTLTPLFPELVPALAVTNAAGQPSSKDPAVAEAGEEGEEDEYDLSLSDLLADVDLGSLEEFVGELLPHQEQASQAPGNDEAHDGEERHGADDQPAMPALESPSAPLPPPSSPVSAPLHPSGGGHMDEVFDFPDDHLYTGPSINACPVKEEVFAPYWANNTRDQVLALLNLYPFEQYIHMETCKHEDEQMLCRPGCKCEQQYRLHRLLAFDPNNECRGIFSDWFRFPSYCVCKCYNFPENYLPRRNRKPNGDDRVPAIPSRTTKDVKLPQESNTPSAGQQQGVQNIPAMLPYEAKDSLLKNLKQQRQERRISLGEIDAKENEVEGAARAEAASASRVDSAEHFLYGNMPVVEYRLSDGTGGTLAKTPR